jgi:hypothetical protein
LLGVASPPASETGISPDGITPHGTTPDPRRKYTKGRLNAQAEAKKPL